MAAVYLLLACALWGLSFPVIKTLQLEQQSRLGDASLTFLAAWNQAARFLLAGILLLPFVARLPRPRAAELRQGLQLALWGGLGMALQAWGLAHTHASTSAFLTQAYCVILPLIACVRTGERPDLRIAGATLLVIAGGGILAGLRPGSLRLGPGESATLLAAMAFTLQILSLENPRYARNRGRSVTLVMCFGIAAIFLPLAGLSAPEPSALLEAGASVPAFALLATLAVFCSVAAFVLMNTWQRHVSATEAGLIYTTEPVFAAVYALVLPDPLAGFSGVSYENETLSDRLFLGGGLILLANIWMQWKRPPHPPAVAPAP